MSEELGKLGWQEHHTRWGKLWEAKQGRRTGRADGTQLGKKELRLHPEGMEMVPTISSLPQLKPGIPLPSPEDLRGKILIKNKKNQFSVPATPSKESVGGAENSCPPSASVGEDPGESARVARGRVWKRLEGERGAGPGGHG